MKTTELQSTDKQIDVSVILCTYNRISMLEEALQSILNQEFDGAVKIILIDDNSSDGTSEIISHKYPEVCLISLKDNVGPYVARNRGLSEAKGKYIAFLDSDDLWQPKYLVTQILALEGQARSFSVSAIIQWDTVKDSKILRLQKPDLQKFTSPIHSLLVRSSFIYSPSSVVLRREVFEEIGLFDESYRIGSDQEFYSRCLIYGYQPIFTEQPLVIVRKHNQGQQTDVNASTIKERRQGRIFYLEKLYPMLENQQQELLPLNRLYAEIYSTAARDFFKNKYYFNWLTSWILDVVKYTSLRYALLNIMRDLLRFMKRYLPTPALTAIRKLFLSNTLST
ncbi:glycosyl transferase 2 family protein [Lyngbya aestuarii BL J]|uniref:Glycosyl transferase 2 family protein n=1 Tax=Lyngbya aestuarii BL J TaxID=1348334 RepID=U7QA82_9CYAN|nr:glycosyltransferase [Lyngbya aestuarii]ERT04733.1 glycosyl transferase 2 family protein [Lyngbya aestuarii BL J]